MKQTKPHLKNRLAIVRRRKLLSQKQISTLLGKKNNDLVSRYERGVQVPTLKNALKLALIYNIPIRVMLDKYYEECRKEIAGEQTQDLAAYQPPVNRSGVEQDEDFCTYEEMLEQPELKPADANKIQAHLIKLMNQRAKALGNM